MKQRSELTERENEQKELSTKEKARLKEREREKERKSKRGYLQKEEEEGLSYSSIATGKFFHFFSRDTCSYTRSADDSLNVRKYARVCVLYLI